MTVSDYEEMERFFADMIIEANNTLAASEAMKTLGDNAFTSGQLSYAKNRVAATKIIIARFRQRYGGKKVGKEVRVKRKPDPKCQSET